MGAIKTWVPNELLRSADLNAAFLTAAQGFMPGIMCPVGPNKPGLAAGAVTELPPGAPTGTNDQGGYWQAGTSRIVIPSGLGGLYAISYIVTTTGGTKGDMGYSFLNGANHGANAFFARSGAAQSTIVAYIANLADAAEVYLTGALLTTGGDLQCGNLRLARLASFGLYR